MEKQSYEHALRHLTSVSEGCKEYANDFITRIKKNKNTKCNLDQLTAIILANDISSSEPLMRILEVNINYLQEMYGDSPDDSIIGEKPEAVEAHEKRIKNYADMLEAVLATSRTY